MNSGIVTILTIQDSCVHFLAWETRNKVAGHRKCLSSNLLNLIVKLLSEVFTSISTSTSNIWVFLLCPYSQQHLVLSDILIFANLNNIKWYSELLKYAFLYWLEELNIFHMLIYSLLLFIFVAKNHLSFFSFNMFMVSFCHSEI